MRMVLLTHTILALAAILIFTVPPIRHGAVGAFDFVTALPSWYSLRALHARVLQVSEKAESDLRGHSEDDGEVMDAFLIWWEAQAPFSEALQTRYAMRMSRLPPRKLQETALSYPDDAEIWLAYAEAAATLPRFSEWADMDMPDLTPGMVQERWQVIALQAHERAIELDPSSAAARFRSAMNYLSQGGEMNREEEYDSHYTPPQRTADETRSLRAGRKLLQQCRQMAPQNAAIDYQLVWTYLAEGRDEEALIISRDAIPKHQWDTYDREVLQSLWRLLEKADVPEHREREYVYSLGSGSEVGSRTRSIARILKELGERFRKSGKHEQAILCYEAVAHLGHMMRVDGYDIVDGLTGIAISGLSVASLLMEEERGQIAEDVRSGKESRDHWAEVAVPKMGEYLRAHGRPDLAAFYAAEAVAGTKWKRQARGLNFRRQARETLLFYSSGMTNAVAIWVVTLAFLVLAALVAMLSVFSSYWRGPQPLLKWSYLDWLMLLAICLVPGQAVALVATYRLQELVRKPAGSSYWWLVVGGCSGVVWLVAVLIVALRKRAQQPSEQGFGRARTCLAALRLLIPPTLAALVLISVVSFWPLCNAYERLNDEWRVIIDQGEASYWRIGTDATGPQSAAGQVPRGQTPLAPRLAAPGRNVRSAQTIVPCSPTHPEHQAGSMKTRWR